MPVIKKYGTTLFFILLFIHCLFIYWGMNDLRTLSKTLLVPVLLITLAANRNKGAGQPGVLVYCGLVFSFLGDVILARPGEFFFLAGMLAFIGTHICNGIFFYRLQKNSRQKGKAVWIAALILVVFSVCIFILLKPYLGVFQWPILFYMCIISLMAVLTAGTINGPSLKKIAINCFIPGACLFVLSDALLAVNKFLWHRPLMDIMVMLSYGAAQYFLVKGFMKVPSVESR